MKINIFLWIVILSIMPVSQAWSEAQIEVDKCSNEKINKKYCLRVNGRDDLSSSDLKSLISEIKRRPELNWLQFISSTPESDRKVVPFLKKAGVYDKLSDELKQNLNKFIYIKDMGLAENYTSNKAAVIVEALSYYNDANDEEKPPVYLSIEDSFEASKFLARLKEPQVEIQSGCAKDSKALSKLMDQRDRCLSEENKQVPGMISFYQALAEISSCVGKYIIEVTAGSLENIKNDCVININSVAKQTSGKLLVKTSQNKSYNVDWNSDSKAIEKTDLAYWKSHLHHMFLKAPTGGAYYKEFSTVPKDSDGTRNGSGGGSSR